MSETWYVVSWVSRSGRRGTAAPTTDLGCAQNYRKALVDPRSSAIRRFASKADADAFYYRRQR